MQTELITDRLRLRRTQPSDLDAVHDLVSDFDVVKMTASWPWPPDRAFTESRCTPIDPALGMGGVVLLGAEIIGMMGLNTKAPGDDVAGLGYAFARGHWGKGYATEMGRALVAHGWARYDYPVLSACVFDDNPASGRVLEKLGFTQTGTCTGFCAARGAELPILTYRLDRP